MRNSSIHNRQQILAIYAILLIGVTSLVLYASNHPKTPGITFTAPLGAIAIDKPFTEPSTREELTTGSVTTGSITTGSITTGSVTTGSLTTGYLDIVSPTARPLWIYFTGHLRSFEEHTMSYYKNWFDAMNVSTQIVMHTWTTLEHSDRTWWGQFKERENKRETVEFLDSFRNIFYDEMKYQIEDYDIVKASIPKPNLTEEATKKMLLYPIICAQRYSLEKVHKLALRVAEKYGGMRDEDVIVKTRPDVRFLKTFNSTQLSEHFKEKPLTIFVICQHCNDYWRSLFASDTFFVTSRLALQKMVDANFTEWFQDQIMENDIYSMTPHPPEYIFRQFVTTKVGLQLMWIPMEFCVEVVRLEGYTAFHWQGACSADFKMINFLN